MKAEGRKGGTRAKPRGVNRPTSVCARENGQRRTANGEQLAASSK